MMTGFLRIFIRCVLFVSLVPGQVLAAEAIKFALIEPLSGPFANIGTGSLHGFQRLAAKDEPTACIRDGERMEGVEQYCDC